MRQSLMKSCGWFKLFPKSLHHLKNPLPILKTVLVRSVSAEGTSPQPALVASLKSSMNRKCHCDTRTPITALMLASHSPKKNYPHSTATLQQGRWQDDPGSAQAIQKTQEFGNCHRHSKIWRTFQNSSQIVLK